MPRRHVSPPLTRARRCERIGQGHLLPGHHHRSKTSTDIVRAATGGPSSPSHHHHLQPITRRHPTNTRIATGDRMRGEPPGERLADLHRTAKTDTPRAPQQTANMPGAGEHGRSLTRPPRRRRRPTRAMPRAQHRRPPRTRERQRGTSDMPPRDDAEEVTRERAHRDARSKTSVGRPTAGRGTVGTHRTNGS